ncbi:MAG: hypothetical protein KF841_05030 [Phycisphaerae bacterium]|nr:hypothetical protein [Phycisphaerae bacterium]
MRRYVPLICLALFMAMNTGCMTAAKRVLKEAQGATSKSRTVPGSSRDQYRSYGAVSVSPATTEVEPLVAPEFMKALRIELVNQLTGGDKPLFRKSDEPALNIDARVMWYHKPGALGDILGTYSYTVVVYTMSIEGRILDRVQIVTKSAASRTDDSDMAASSAKELVEWFGARREGEFEEDEEAKVRREEDRRRRDKE